MSSLVSLTAAAAVLLHTLLGCCLHHQHRCVGEIDRGVQTAAGVEPCCHSPDSDAVGDAATNAVADASRRSNRHDSGRQEDGPHESGSEPCEGTACAFRVESASHADLRLDFLAHWTAAVDLAEAGSLVPFRCDSHRRAPLEPPRVDRPQSRLCVWRI